IEKNNDHNYNEILEELNEFNIRDVICGFGSDPDPRAALKALLQLHRRGCKLDMSLYNMCVTCLSDDYEEVRIEALSLIWVLSTIHPEHMMSYALDDGKTQKIRLLDDAFIKICDMVYDGSVKVRSKACTIMGSYRQVGESILLETLSQKVISHGKTRKSNQGYGKNKRSRFIPTPEGDLDVESEELPLLKSNVCGAFIHGLEDAYQDVRNAAIDMFQDEIDSVRLNSINSLCKIGTKYPIELDSELLQITVCVLNDSDPVVRMSTHRMLGVAKLKSQDLIPQFVDSLIPSMNKYPEDQLSIYRCFKNVGLTHGDYIEHYVPIFFKMESTYISREIKQNDPQRNLILVFNASTTNPKILSMLPDYAGRHYEYLRIKFPDCFPDVNISGDSPMQVVQIDQSDTDGKSAMYTCKQMSRSFDANFKIRLARLDYMLSFMGATLKDIRSLGQLFKHRNFNINGMSERQQTLFRGFSKRIKDSERRLENRYIPLREIGKARSKLEKFQKNPNFGNATQLFDYISEFNLLDIGIGKNIRVTEATITQPASNPTVPIDFQSQFPLPINIEAEIHDINDPGSLAIQVLSQSNESSYIQLGIVREYQPDLPDVDAYITRLGAGGIINNAVSGCSLALSEQRLAIVGLDTGAQPLYNDDETIFLSVNGEIYNHKILAKQIKGNPHFRTHSDCEVILHLYNEVGKDVVNYLDGMFSFVLLDTTKNRFLAARDPIGITTLYQGWSSSSPGTVYFSSELKALNEECDKIIAFPPGHIYDSETGETTRYYQPSWWDESLIPTTPIDYKLLRESLEKAVRKRLMSDVPYGVLLSGGLDSSLIASIASREAKKLVAGMRNGTTDDERRELGTDKLHSFSIGLPGSPDLKAARSVAKFLKTLHHEFTFTIQEGLDAIHDIIYHLETYDVTTIRASTPMYLLSRKIKALGVKMVLSGEGSDEILGGYLYFHAAPSAEDFHKETVTRVKHLHTADCLRANKSTMAWGLEARVPFLDKDFLDVAMSINPEEKMFKEGKMEKYILRKAFDVSTTGDQNPYLPDSILWRQKEQFSDGVGYGWIDSLKEAAESHITDDQMADAAQRWPKDTPRTKEAYWYREQFESWFPQDACTSSVKLWIPRKDW
ncbi:4298_t:CDS:10, partial [Acaulospora colombiana]